VVVRYCDTDRNLLPTRLLPGKLVGNKSHDYLVQGCDLDAYYS
jgi:hypothetical protein